MFAPRSPGGVKNPILLREIWEIRFQPHRPVERQRRLILTAGMIAARGRVQREGIVIHVVAEHLTDLSDLLRRLGQSEEGFVFQPGRGDEARGGGGGNHLSSKRA